MEYRALYRRFRPQIFEDIVGQDSITTTLKNQIKSSKISHAYLFCGTRGTGKTSTARILARAVNCSKPQDSNPCNKCDICQEILKDNNIDVIEIDAASNRGVENIRELRETVKFPPSRGRYKIYIIDEVHMLTTEAFNALLKTLEEPPDHIIFILATTDPERLPATILSRCQRFDFKILSTGDIIKRLGEVAKALEIEVEEEALRIIAINSEGALRDALSVLEQCVSFMDEKLTGKDVVDILGIVNYETIYKLVEAIINQDTPMAISIIQKIIDDGKDIQQLIKDLIYYFRNLMMVKLGVELEELLIISEEILKNFEIQSNRISTEAITEAIYSLSETETKAKYSRQPRILLEISIVSLCHRRGKHSIEGLIERIEKLEEKVISFPEAGARERPHDEVRAKDRKEPKAIIETREIQGGVEAKAGGKKEEKNLESIGDFTVIKEKWQEIREFIIRDKKAQVEAFLKEGSLEGIKEGRLIISFNDDHVFHRDNLARERNSNYISEVIEKITGQKLQLSFVLLSEIGKKKEDNDQDILEEKLKEFVPKGMLEIVDE